MPPRRLATAVRLVDPQPGDRILEIGGGTGAAAELVLAVPGVHYTGVDRSEHAIRTALERNARAVADGRAEFLLGDLRSFDPAGRLFDAGFAVNVNVFSTGDTQPHLAVLARALKPEAPFYLCYESPTGEITERVVSAVSAAFTTAGFDCERIAEPGLAVFRSTLQP